MRDANPVYLDTIINLFSPLYVDLLIVSYMFKHVLHDRIQLDVVKC